MSDGQIQITRYKVTQRNKTLEKDPVVIEEPLQIDIVQCRFHTTYSITLRTPGDDEALCCGLLFSEGIIRHINDVLSIEPSQITGKIDANKMILKLSPSLKLNLNDQLRRTPSYSGCGLCGKTSLQALALKNYRPQKKIKVPINIKLIIDVRKQLAQQSLFNETGGCHVAGIVFESKNEPDEPISLDIGGALFFEDVGRHNALDKLIGFQLRDNDLSRPGVVVLSGRVGYELVQKIVMAGYSTIIALGAPTSLAIQAANQFGVEMIGFAKDDQYNLYTF